MAMGVMPFFNPRRAFTFTFIGQTTDPTDTATHSFAGVSISAADAGRLVVVSYEIRNSAGNVALAGGGITIGGVAATVAHAAGTNLAAGVAYAVVPTGTTATIVINCAASGETASIGVYVIYGYQSATAFDTDAPAGGGDSARSVSIDVPAGGCVIVSAVTGNVTGVVWTNANEDFDVVPESGHGHSGASKTSATAITPETITATSCRAIAAVSFR